MKCPTCNSEISLFQRKQINEPWYCYTCNNCGTRLRLDGRRRMFSNILILLVGLGIATFFEDFPFIFFIIAASTIYYVGKNLYKLTPYPEKNGSDSN
jgi:hypothetical protein